MYVVGEALLLGCLEIELASAESVLVLQASLSHSQVVDNEPQVPVDFSEVDHLTFHPSYVFM
jgi:hypothetical protein